MKLLITIFLLGFGVTAYASDYPNAEDAVLKLTCTTQITLSSNNQPFKSLGSRTFNLTIYKKNQTFYIKQQTGTYAPTWMGKNLTHTQGYTTIRSTVTMTNDEIYSSTFTKLNDSDTKGTHDLTINRLNGSVRIGDYFYGDKNLPEDRYVSTGTCEKTQNKF